LVGVIGPDIDVCTEADCFTRMTVSPCKKISRPVTLAGRRSTIDAEQPYRPILRVVHTARDLGPLLADLRNPPDVTEG